MTKEVIKTDICIIGAGSGGLSLAAGAVQMGASVVLIEHDKMGGDCLNAGCVPSKSLLAAAHVAACMRYAQPFGIESVEPKVDYAKVRDHVQGVIAEIAPNDSQARFEKLGVKVIRAEGRFLDENTVEAGGKHIRARRFVVATGSHPSTPPIEGLDQVPYLTNETIFDLKENPGHIILIGGGPIGCEMASAHARLGTKVSLLDVATIMPKDDPELVSVVRKSLQDEGIDLHENIEIIRVEKTTQGVAVVYQANGKEKQIEGSHLLVAAGRKPNLENLNLKAAQVKTERGIVTDQRLRSVSNKKVYAIGDAVGSFQFTHAASYHAGIVIRNILFGLPAKVDYRALPWCTYTSPELAHVGMQEAQAKEKVKGYRVLRFAFEDNDRAHAERVTQGMIKVVINRKGVVLGCSIVGAKAGELILPWMMATQEKMKIGKMANLIAPYPTLSEISKRVAGSYYTDTLFSPRMKKLVRFLQKILP